MASFSTNAHATARLRGFWDATMQFLRSLRSQIQYKIILPFLLLTMLVALAGSAASILFITSSAQERLNNQLAQTARATSDSIVQLERANLQFLREVAFAGPNESVNAPSMADAFASGNSTLVARALDPYFAVSRQRQGVQVDRMIAFDQAGFSIIDWDYQPDSSDTGRVAYGPRDISALWFVKPILGRQSDPLGDKYAGLLDFGSDQHYLFSVAPVLNGDTVVGGIFVASRLDTVATSLLESSSAAIVSVYRAEDGGAFASTQVPVEGLAALSIPRDQLASIRDGANADQQAVFDTVSVNERQYQFAYVPLQIRGEQIGLLSVALSSDYVIGPWAEAGVPLMTLTAALMLAIVGLGVYVARQITRPLKELVVTAEAVTGGNLERRSIVQAQDEVGILSRSFNEMTEHLVDLYGEVRAEASQRAAIVESIADGVVVCDPDGSVLVINRAMRMVLGLREQQEPPSHFNAIMMRPLEETTLAFGEARTPDLFNLGGRVVRVVAAPVTSEDGERLGDVFVFQDLTSEVAIDRAKTNFIATISHELRTPLTVLGGSADLLLRGFVGDLNDDQRTLINAMHKHTQSMTGLLNNVIIVAGLESGTLAFEFEPLTLRQVIDDLLWGVRPGLRAKGLQLIIDVPNDLPDVVADRHQLRNVLNQLLDNARRYTSSGTLTIAAYAENERVRVDIRDTGGGIDPEAGANLFDRFVRGAEGINSAERGIGLGLAIAKQLVERQGGTIWLAETSECGTTFSFTLPCNNADTEAHNSAIEHAA